MSAALQHIRHHSEKRLLAVFLGAQWHNTPLPRQKGCPAPLLHAGPWLADTPESICTNEGEKNITQTPEKPSVNVCNRLQTSASRSELLQDGLVLMTKMKKLNLCSFLHLVKEIMHFPQSLMPAPQGLYYYLLFCLLK